MQYLARFTHKISPKDTDVSGPFELDAIPTDAKLLGAMLRKLGLLCKGQRIRSHRVEGSKVIIFPAASSWHSISIAPV